MVNDSEQYVYDICQKTFLSLWSYANPLGKKGKELCDILVVCGDDIVIVSVKDIKPTDSGDLAVDWDRWTKRAIDGSVKQIYGAERWLQDAGTVIQHDGSEGLSLPPTDQRRVHRIAVAFGGEGQMPLHYGDFGKGFVHVLEERGFDILLSELDTITDFLDYLRAKEDYFNQGGTAFFEGHEEDLLALYLFNNRTFPEEATLLVVGDGLWDEVSSKPEFIAKKREDEASYLWDALIETHTKGIAEGRAYFSPGLLTAEPALRELALEDRYWRRMLSKALYDFLELAKARKIRSRIAPSPERNVAYVFLPARPDEDPQMRIAELAARVWVARDSLKDYHTVVGLAVGEFKADHPLHLFYLYKPEWDEEDQRRAKEAREELGFFKSPVFKRGREDEYPAA